MKRFFIYNSIICLDTKASLLPKQYFQGTFNFGLIYSYLKTYFSHSNKKTLQSVVYLQHLTLKNNKTGCVFIE